MKTSRSLISFLLLFLISSVAAQNYWEDFPVRANPKTVGDKLSKRFLESNHQLYFDRGIHYAEVCTWYGALRFAELTNNKEFDQTTAKSFRTIVSYRKRSSSASNSCRSEYVRLSAFEIV